jgi:protein-disulfide isomerase
MKIEIVGTGGSLYRDLFSNTLEALRESGKKGKVVVVRDLRKIIKYGIMATPALVLNGVVMFSGRLGSPEEIIALLQSSLKSVV